jgi:hypothetical protein
MKTRFLIYFLTISLILPLPCSAQFRLDTLKYAGDSQDYTDILFLGDGYTAAQLSKFVSDVKSHTDYFFNKEPWKRYSNMFNVFYIQTPSNVSGAGMTPDAPIDNFYKTTFGCAGVDRMPWPTDMNKVYEVLNSTKPDYDMLIILVNSTKYGGAGNGSMKMMCVSLDGSSKETICHEAGHAFAGLADEYWYDRDYECPNDARQINPVKWQRWVGTSNVGVYPFEDTQGWYRPHEQCLMRYLDRDYCAVCREAIIETIHETSKILRSYYPSVASYKKVHVVGDTVFSLQLVAPKPNTLRREWILDGQRVAYNKDSFQFKAQDYANGSHTLSVTIEDTTLMVRAESHSTAHINKVKWRILNEVESGITLIGADEYEFSVGPIPFTDELTFSQKQPSAEPARMELYTVQGTEVAKGVFPGNTPAVLQTSNLAPGIYILRIYVGNEEIYSRKVTKEK